MLQYTAVGPASKILVFLGVFLIIFRANLLCVGPVYYKYHTRLITTTRNLRENRYYCYKSIDDRPIAAYPVPYIPIAPGMKPGFMPLPPGPIPPTIAGLIALGIAPGPVARPGT